MKTGLNLSAWVVYDQTYRLMISNRGFLYIPVIPEAIHVSCFQDLTIEYWEKIGPLVILFTPWNLVVSIHKSVKSEIHLRDSFVCDMVTKYIHYVLHRYDHYFNVLTKQYISVGVPTKTQQVLNKHSCYNKLARISFCLTNKIIAVFPKGTCGGLLRLGIGTLMDCFIMNLLFSFLIR